MNVQEIDTFKDGLKNFYKGQNKIIKLIDGIDETDRSFNDYYIKPRIIIKEEDGEKKDIGLKDLFGNFLIRSKKDSNIPSSKASEKILIFGEAGVGKSTLMHYITYKWGLDELWKAKFSYVYRVSLKPLRNKYWISQHPRDSGKNRLKCLVDDSLKADSNYVKRGENEEIRLNALPWVEANKEEVLLLLDGYDEIAHLLETQEFQDIYNEIFKFRYLIISSRPKTVPYKTRARFDLMVEHYGFDNEGIEQYFNRNLKNEQDSKKGEEFRTLLSKNPIIKEICKIPVNLAMICYIYKGSEFTQHIDRITTISDLYKLTINHLGYRYFQRKLKIYEPEKKYELKERVKKFDLDEFTILTYVAYKSLTNGGIISAKSDTEGINEIPGAIIYEGNTIDREDEEGTSLLSCINFLANRSEIASNAQYRVTLPQLYQYGLLMGVGTSASVRNASNGDDELESQEFSFIHKTFQEYAAATYLKKKLGNGTSEDQKLFWDFLANHRNDPQYAMTLKFMAGMVSADRSTKGNSLIQLFWETMSCNVDGVLELGIETKAGLILNLLGQATVIKDKKIIIDPRIPNLQVLVDFVDVVVLKDIFALFDQLEASGYMSEIIKEGVLKMLVDKKQEWHIQEMRRIAERSLSPALKSAIKVMIEQKKEQLERDPTQESTQMTMIIHTIGVATSLASKISEGQKAKDRYCFRVIKGLMNILKTLKNKDIDLIGRVFQAIKKMVIEMKYADNYVNLEKILEKLRTQLSAEDFRKTIASPLVDILNKMSKNDKASKNLKNVFEFLWRKSNNLKRADLHFDIILDCCKSVSQEILNEFLERLFPFLKDDRRRSWKLRLFCYNISIRHETELVDGMLEKLIDFLKNENTKFFAFEAVGKLALVAPNLKSRCFRKILDFLRSGGQDLTEPVQENLLSWIWISNQGSINEYIQAIFPFLKENNPKVEGIKNELFQRIYQFNFRSYSEDNNRSARWHDEVFNEILALFDSRSVGETCLITETFKIIDKVTKKLQTEEGTAISNGCISEEQKVEELIPLLSNRHIDMVNHIEWTLVNLELKTKVINELLILLDNNEDTLALNSVIPQIMEKAGSNAITGVISMIIDFCKDKSKTVKMNAIITIGSIMPFATKRGQCPKISKFWFFITPFLGEEDNEIGRRALVSLKGFINKEEIKYSTTAVIRFLCRNAKTGNQTVAENCIARLRSLFKSKNSKIADCAVDFTLQLLINAGNQRVRARALEELLVFYQQTNKTRNAKEQIDSKLFARSDSILTDQNLIDQALAKVLPLLQGNPNFPLAFCVQLIEDAIQTPGLTELTKETLKQLYRIINANKKEDDDTKAKFIASYIFSGQFEFEWLNHLSQKLKDALLKRLADYLQKFNNKCQQIDEHLQNGQLFPENCIGNVKAHELVKVALHLIGVAELSKEHKHQKQVLRNARKILNFQIEHITEDGVAWLNENLETLLNISKESKLFFNKLYSRLFKGEVSSEIEKEIILKLIKHGFITSITRERQVILEGKRYDITGSNTEELLEKISEAVLNQNQYPLAIQYQEHKPIFKRDDKKLDMKASSDLEDVFSMFSRDTKLLSDKWLLTKLDPCFGGQPRYIFEKRSFLGDWVIYDMSRKTLIKIHPLDLKKELEGLFGPIHPQKDLHYFGQSKYVEIETGNKIAFSRVVETDLGKQFENHSLDKKLYFQDELLNQTYSQRDAWIEQELDNKLDNGKMKLHKKLSKQLSLDEDQKKKLTDYFNAFSDTFQAAYHNAVIISQQTVPLNIKTSGSIEIVTAFLGFIPTIGKELANAVMSVDNYITSEKIINHAKRMRQLQTQNTVTDLGQLVNDCALKLVLNKDKQEQIDNAPEQQREELTWFEAMRRKVLSEYAGVRFQGELYSTSAAKLGNEDANKLIQEWLNKDTTIKTYDDILRNFVNPVLPVTSTPSLRTDSRDNTGQKNKKWIPCQDCNLF